MTSMTLQLRNIVKHFNTSFAEDFYPLKITATWNALPYEVVSRRTVNIFRKFLQKHWVQNPPDAKVNS